MIFCFFYGFSATTGGGDMERYEREFHRWTEVSDFNLFNYYFQVYSGGDYERYDLMATGKPDVFAVTMLYLTSRVSNSPKLFFGLVGLVYFWLLFLFYDEVIQLVGFRNEKRYKIYLFFLLMIVPFGTGIMGVRFWHGLFFYLLFLMKLLRTKNPQYLIILPLASLFHYTFIFPALFSAVIYFLPLNKLLLRILVILSLGFGLASSNASLVGQAETAVSLVGSEDIEESTSGYLDASKYKQTDDAATGSSKRWYAKYRFPILIWFLVIVYFLHFFKYVRAPLGSSLIYEKFLSAFFILSMLTMNLGSLGRFIYVFVFLMIILLLSSQWQIQHNRVVNKVIENSFYFVIFLNIIVIFRGQFYTVNPFLLVSPSVLLPFLDSDVSLSELLVGH